MEKNPFLGQVALVTGGATRLGREIALGLARHGADIALHYNSSADQALSAATEIRSLGRTCHLVQADLTLIDSPAQIFHSLPPALGPVDILINSAGLFERGTLAESSPEQWERLIAVNIRSAFFLCQAFARQTKKGSIVNIADWRAEQPDPDFLVYSISKSALLTLTHALARTLAPGIRVNAVAPGAILPPAGANPEYIERVKSKIPLQRFGSPADVLEAIVYLLAAPFITGEVMHVTGGQEL
jgi:pteridine reductase